jgi:small subunit ribosomal protein S20
MPITKGAEKAVRVTERKRLFNDRRRRAMRRVLKSIENKLSEKDMAGATELLPEAYKALDKAAKRGIIKPNNASRKKSRLVAAIKRAGEKTTVEAKPKKAKKTATAKKEEK